MFHVGQMVVYIGDGALLQKGRVYTIRGFCTQEHEDEEVGLYVEEYEAKQERVGPINYCSCFRLDVFRPVRETSIDIFRKIVADLPLEIDANV